MPIYMKYEDIDGESTDKGHEKWIELLSYSWGMSNPISGVGGGGSGGSTGRPMVQDMMIGKSLDKSSPKLAESCATGRHAPMVQLDIAKPAGGRVVYLKYTLSNCFVTSYQVGGDADDRPTEELALNFSKIKFDYQEQGKGGQPVGDPVSFEYDVQLNT